MVLVPPYVEVDGLVVPLHIDPADSRGPAVVRMTYGPERPLLQPLMYVVNAMLARAEFTRWVDLLEQKQKLPMPDGLAAAPITQRFEDYEDSAENWQKLTGYRPDLEDSYSIGTTFLRTDLAVPRTTLIKLMRRLIELDSGVLAKTIEPRIDTSIAVPLPRSEPPLVKPWPDDEWLELEERAQLLDEMDPLTSEMVDFSRAEQIRRSRRELFDMLTIAWVRTSKGSDDMPARCRELGLGTLLAYDAAATELLAYLHETDGDAVAKRTMPETPYAADVSVDAFRLPRPRIPEGYSWFGWLARCEAVFRGDRGGPEKLAGDMFSRIDGHMVRLRYRSEAGPGLVLWRAELV